MVLVYDGNGRVIDLETGNTFIRNEDGSLLCNFGSGRAKQAISDDTATGLWSWLVGASLQFPKAPQAQAEVKSDFDMELCTVPVGSFIMGSADSDALAYDDEKPARSVEIPYTYRIGKYPVTNAQYRQFAQATDQDWSMLEGKDNHPVVNVSWRDAVAFCEWLTSQWRAVGKITSNEVVRLPSETEWEKAARGTDGRIWPWGNEFDKAKCNSAKSGKDSTIPVGAYSSQGDSPYGCADMVGNVWEWCATKWQDSYRGYRDDNSPEGDALRVLRGGAFLVSVRVVRCAYRYRLDPDFRDYYVGFRVVVASLS